MKKIISVLMVLLSLASVGFGQASTKQAISIGLTWPRLGLDKQPNPPLRLRSGTIP